jgi:hypothetical protein
MARRDQVEIRAPEGSEHGSSARLQELEAALPAPVSEEEAPGGPVPGPVEGIEVPEEELALGEEDEDDELAPEGEDEEMLFGPPPEDDIPTAGFPWGPGSNTVRPPRLSDRVFLRRVAETLARSGFSDARKLADRIGRERLGIGRLER